MPIYEYLCEKCQHEFEREQRISDPPVRTCPVCRSRKVKKLISRTSFVLKGGGWYSDLYSSSRPGSDGAADKGAADAGSGASESKTAEKPADKTTEKKTEKKADKKSNKKTSGKSAA